MRKPQRRIPPRKISIGQLDGYTASIGRTPLVPVQISPQRFRASLKPAESNDNWSKTRSMPPVPGSGVDETQSKKRSTVQVRYSGNSESLSPTPTYHIYAKGIRSSPSTSGPVATSVRIWYQEKPAAFVAKLTVRGWTEGAASLLEAATSGFLKTGASHKREIERLESRAMCEGPEVESPVS